MEVSGHKESFQRIGDAACLPSCSVLAQLTVFAAAPVIAAEFRLVAVVCALTRHAQPNAGISGSPCLRNFRFTLGAVRCRGSLGQLALNAADRVLYGRIDLILYGSVTCPTRRHFPLLMLNRARAPRIRYLCIPSGTFSSARLPEPVPRSWANCAIGDFKALFLIGTRSG